MNFLTINQHIFEFSCWMYWIFWQDGQSLSVLSFYGISKLHSYCSVLNSVWILLFSLVFKISICFCAKVPINCIFCICRAISTFCLHTPWWLLMFAFKILFVCAVLQVTAKLVGSDAESSIHHLTDPDKPVLERGSCDMFLLSTPFPLGEVRHLRLQHDNSGGHPSWYWMFLNSKGSMCCSCTILQENWYIYTWRIYRYCTVTQIIHLVKNFDKLTFKTDAVFSMYCTFIMGGFRGINAGALKKNGIH